jgi:DNA-binding transcriptional LysR family regulator
VKAPLDDIVSMALFAEVVRLRSFTAAGASAGLAKSAVSRRISLLEERLGVRLLQRTTRTLSLTEDGLRYYEHCAALLAAAAAAEEAVAGASTVPRGPLRVNAPVTFAQMFLAAPLASFLARYPAIELQLSTDDRLVDVVEGGFDLVIRISRLADSSLVARRLATDRLVVCGSPTYLAARGRPGVPADLVGHNCLHYSLVPVQGEWRFRGAAGSLDVPVTSNFAVSDATVLRQAALAGLGLIVVPHFVVAADVAAGRLELVLDGARRAEIGIHAVYPSRRQLPARTKLLLEHLASHFADPDWRLRDQGVAAPTERAPRPRVSRRPSPP